MTRSPNYGITLLGDNDNVDPAIVTLNSGILDTAGPVVLFSPASFLTPQPPGAFDGQWRYNSLNQTRSRWNSTKNEWQAIGMSDKWVDPFAQRPKLLQTSVKTAAATIAGGGAGLAQVDLNSFTFTVNASGSGTGDFPTSQIYYVERGWFWWTGTPYPPTSKLYKAQIFCNVGYKTTPSGTAPESTSGNAIGPAGISANTKVCIANATFGYNSDKMSCKVPYQLVSQFQVQAQDVASTVTVSVRSVFQTDSSQFPATMTAGRSADALGSAKSWIYQVF
jgi:hypothetical protein